MVTLTPVRVMLRCQHFQFIFIQQLDKSMILLQKTENVLLLGVERQQNRIQKVS